MASFNKVMLLGNLTRDPEVRFTPKGTAVCTFGLAVNRTWSGEDGQKKEEVTFVECDAWGKQAETIGQYMSKGKPIFIEGRLKLDSWDDKESGQKRSKLKVIVESFQFLGVKPDQGENREEDREQSGSSTNRQARQAPSHRRPTTRSSQGELAGGMGESADENIPF